MADTIDTTLKAKAANTWRRLKLIDKNEEPNSVIQLIGFLLIAVGVIFLLVKLIEPRATATNPMEGAHVAIAFFIISLGISFAFPDLLQDPTGGLSTMRIVVFMMVNVICMLMLKIGWAADNFTDIGINGYWVGIIAFVFGSKATQSFFESPMATALVQQPQAKPVQAATPATVSGTPAGDELTRRAIAQHQVELKEKYSNILSLSDTINRVNGAMVHVVAIYVRDNDIAKIPATLPVDINGTKYSVNTDVVANVGNAAAHISQANDAISDSDTPAFKGSICCAVKSTVDPAFFGLVTSGHIYTGGDYTNYFGILKTSNRTNALINGNVAGTWYLQQLDDTQDLAVAQLASKPDTTVPPYTSFAAGYYPVANTDIKPGLPNVTIVSRNKVRDAYIVDTNVTFPVTYEGKDFLMGNIILVGSTNDDKCTTVSGDGDSGSCVYHKGTGKLIGMLMGGNLKYTLVLPLKDTLDSYHLQPI